MIFGTLDLQEINRAQDLLWGWLPKWGVVLQPFGSSSPHRRDGRNQAGAFDLPEGESRSWAISLNTAA